MDDNVVMTFGEFRRICRLCPKGHKKGLTRADKCFTCENNELRDKCKHEGLRYWQNPSNLPGNNRYVCGACGKSGLPQP